METVLQIFQALGYITLLLVLASFWRLAFRRPGRLWGLLALAWTMNLLGNIAWALHDLVTGAALDTFSAVDLFFVLRYALIGVALWLYPTPLPRRDGVWVGMAAFVVNAVVWLVYFTAAMNLRGGDWTAFVGLAMYPVFDAGMIALAWLRVRAARESAWSGYAALLFGAMISYGMANTINLSEYVFQLSTGGVPQNVFWVLTDLFALSAALAGSSRQEMQKSG